MKTNTKDIILALQVLADDYHNVICHTRLLAKSLELAKAKLTASEVLDGACVAAANVCAMLKALDPDGLVSRARIQTLEFAIKED